MRPQIDPAVLARATPEQRALIDRELAALDALADQNPLQALKRNPKQEVFFGAQTRTVAAIAGNQFGKTTSLVVKSLIEVLPEEALPKWMRPFKRYSGVVQGRLVCPSYALVEQNLLPTFRDWTPKQFLKGGTFERAWNSQKSVLMFADGSFVDFLTYETDLDKFGGVRRHFVGYDEPPPQKIRDEGLGRLMRFGGFEMFAFTPLKANTGWLRREIYKKRESPDMTVVQGSVHDNTALDAAARDYFLENLSNDLWRRAREFGDFIEVGGLIYPDFEKCVLKQPFDRGFIQSLDVVVGIDNGIRNAGIVYVGFDDENVAYVFDEVLLQDQTPTDYAEAIREKNRYWGLKADDVSYVVDPAARQRSQTNRDTVLSILQQEEIYALPGQNDRDAGFSQLRTRMQYGRFHVSPVCLGLRDEADDYAAEEPGEGKDDSHLVPIKGNDHRLDALRYACMQRLWDPIVEESAPARKLGWAPGADIPGISSLTLPPRGGAPLGSMS